jgi:MFS family permease
VTHLSDQVGLFRFAPFRNYWFARLTATLAVQIISVAVGWQVYTITRDPWDLGLIGLVQFLPALLLVLVTGAVADKVNRRSILTVCLVGEAVCCLMLLALTYEGLSVVWPVFVVLTGFGIARAFYGPASSSLLPNIVRPEMLSGAIALSTSAWQGATIVGPVLGGLLFGISAYAAYGTALALLALSAVLTLFIPKAQQLASHQASNLEELLAGFRYVWHEKVVLGAISLDLFAVLLGGAVALLPVYALDILHAGPEALGLLRASPGIGAIVVALLLARYPVRDHAGLIMFAFVALFGMFTVVFGLSTQIWLSVIALVMMGACDMVSVYVRETLLQLWTPDAVRGRVNAVNNVFVGASNELGEFRAGGVARLIGAEAAVVIGGVGTVLVAFVWAGMFPQLRRARHLAGRV